MSFQWWQEAQPSGQSSSTWVLSVRKSPEPLNWPGKLHCSLWTPNNWQLGHHQLLLRRAWQQVVCWGAVLSSAGVHESFALCFVWGYCMIICHLLIQYFNSRSCQLVLGAGALQVVGLKTITTKNLGMYLSRNNHLFVPFQASRTLNLACRFGFRVNLFLHSTY